MMLVSFLGGQFCLTKNWAFVAEIAEIAEIIVEKNAPHYHSRARSTYILCNIHIVLFSHSQCFSRDCLLISLACSSLDLLLLLLVMEK